MADHKDSNRARVILEAVRLASAAEVQTLHQLIARERETLQFELVLRILLTYLPESTEPRSYLELLRQLTRGAVHAPVQPPRRPAQSGREPSDKEAQHQVRQLHLLPLAEERDLQAGCTDVLALFLIHRARKIDIETGSILEIQELLEPFVDRDAYLPTWMISNVLALRRLDYEYYPQTEDPYTLEAFEKLEGRLAIDVLLSRSARDGKTETIQSARDIRGVVGPWIYGESRRKRRKMQHDRRRSSLASPRSQGQDASVEEEDSHRSWSHVNDWVVELALRDFPGAAETVEQWDGPGDVDYGGFNDIGALDSNDSQSLTRRYAQAALATLYANSGSSASTLDTSYLILRKVAHLSGLEDPPRPDEPQTSSVSHVTTVYRERLSEVHLLHNALLRPENPMTSPTQASLSFTNLVLTSCALLSKLANSKSCRAAAGLVAFASHEEQKNELHKTLQKVPVKTRDEDSWAVVRHQILWLRDWHFQAPGTGNHDGEDSLGVFGKVKRVDVEVDLLRTLLRASCRLI